MADEGYVDAEGGRVFYRVVGDGDGIPVLCLHGGPGFTHDYLEPLGRLGRGRRVIFYDQLGCGRSERPSSKGLWRLERFVTELQQVRDAAGLDRVHLLGHSWGGCLAATYALGQPRGLTSLVLASPLISVGRWLDDAAALRRALPADVRSALDRHEENGYTDCPEYVAATLAFYKRHLCRVDPWPEELERTWAGLGIDVYVTMWGPTEFYVTGNLMGYDLTDRLGEIEAPTLFTCGRYDEATPETVASFHERIEGAELAVFQESSHTPHLEERDNYLERIAAFIERVEAR